jgi:Nucleotidyl transferase AbiEii toxin, Type IV TA system
MSKHETNDIWTYERAVGRRLLVPWVSEGHTGAVQVDVTFEEEIPGSIETVAVGPKTVRCVSKETSLVWKLMWLLTDGHPQGKDFFDAVLLAKNVQLSAESKEWLRRVVAQQDPGFIGDIVPEPLGTQDWSHFESEYPSLAARTTALKLHSELQRHLDT